MAPNCCFLKEENKLQLCVLLAEKNTGIILQLCMNVLFFLFKELHWYTDKHGAFQVFWRVSSFQYLWSLLLCIWLNSCGFWFMLFVAWSELDLWPWVWTHLIITQTHINMHIPTHTYRKYTIWGPVGSEKEHSCKGFELIDWGNKFQMGGYLFPPLQKQSGG